ncbi:MAG: ribosome maturation factor RimM [Terracidiphilus sp.]
MAAAEQWVWLAQIRRTQGRKGEVFAEILTDFPEKFAERKRLWLLVSTTSAGDRGLARPVDLLAHWLHKGGVVLHFAGIDSISAAEGLIGLVVAIPQEERAPLGEDETYIGDLIGCMLVDVTGDAALEVGPIEDIDMTTGAAPLLVLKGARGEVLVPFAKSYLRRIDLEGKRVEMKLPEGLRELNHES